MSASSPSSEVVGEGWIPPYPTTGITQVGTILKGSHAVFTPFKMRGLTLKNRIVISPMYALKAFYIVHCPLQHNNNDDHRCQYSSRDGFANDWHLRHLGTFAVGGASLVFVEGSHSLVVMSFDGDTDPLLLVMYVWYVIATGVEAIGRISPFDMGLWKDEQIAPLKRIVQFLRGMHPPH
jgi:2,4-dienoyl-CoA reductase-like NADH-dependent reductase (Old Yellow Enzyme family)